MFGNGRKKKQNKFKYSKKYVPDYLSNSNKKKAIKELNKSRKLYKKGIYYQRKKIKGYKPKKSNHLKKVKDLYDIDKVKPSKELSKATSCDIKGLREIESKGMGAFFSSGSRISQTPQSWGRGRLASAITGGKASKVDYHILKKYCKKNSLPLKLAIKIDETSDSIIKNKIKSNMVSCCSLNSKTEKKVKQCITKKKIFKLPRKFTKSKCLNRIKGFSMRSSCAPYKYCNYK